MKKAITNYHNDVVARMKRYSTLREKEDYRILYRDSLTDFAQAMEELGVDFDWLLEKGLEGRREIIRAYKNEDRNKGFGSVSIHLASDPFICLYVPGREFGDAVEAIQNRLSDSWVVGAYFIRHPHKTAKVMRNLVNRIQNSEPITDKDFEVK